MANRTITPPKPIGGSYTALRPTPTGTMNRLTPSGVSSGLASRTPTGTPGHTPGRLSGTGRIPANTAMLSHLTKPGLGTGGGRVSSPGSTNRTGTPNPLKTPSTSRIGSGLNTAAQHGPLPGLGSHTGTMGPLAGLGGRTGTIGQHGPLAGLGSHTGTIGPLAGLGGHTGTIGQHGPLTGLGSHTGTMGQHGPLPGLGSHTGPTGNMQAMGLHTPHHPPLWGPGWGPGHVPPWGHPGWNPGWAGGGWGPGWGGWGPGWNPGWAGGGWGPGWGGWGGGGWGGGGWGGGGWGGGGLLSSLIATNLIVDAVTSGLLASSLLNNAVNFGGDGGFIDPGYVPPVTGGWPMSPGMTTIVDTWGGDTWGGDGTDGGYYDPNVTLAGGGDVIPTWPLSPGVTTTWVLPPATTQPAVDVQPVAPPTVVVAPPTDTTPPPVDVPQPLPPTVVDAQPPVVVNAQPPVVVPVDVPQPPPPAMVDAPVTPGPLVPTPPAVVDATPPDVTTTDTTGAGTTPPDTTTAPPPDTAVPTTTDTAGTPTGGNRVVLVNPAELNMTVHYTIENQNFEMDPNYTQELAGEGSWVIEFDRGGGFGQAEYTLTDGTYTFTMTDKGLDLWLTTYQVQLDNSTNTDEFNFALGDQVARVEAGQTKELTSRYPIVLEYDRGDGKETTTKELSNEKTYHVGLNPETSLLDLLARPGSGRGHRRPPRTPR